MSFRRLYQSRHHLVCSNYTKVSLKGDITKKNITCFVYCAGAKITADSESAELRGSFQISGPDAPKLEVRVRSRLPVRCKQPTLSVANAQAQVLEAAAGGEGRLTVQPPTRKFKIVLKQWTKDAVAKVFAYNNELSKKLQTITNFLGQYICISSISGDFIGAY